MELANLAVERLGVGMLGHRFRATLACKQLLRLLPNFLFPQTNLHRVHTVLLGNLVDCLDSA